MRILVTGSCGYIGSMLEHGVIGFDAGFFGGSPDIVGDIRKPVFPKCDVVIHMAGITSDKGCQLKPDFAQQVNVDAMKGVINAAILAGAHRFIFTSSCAVYGSTETPARETDPCKPTTLYSSAKMRCEEILNRFRNDLEIVILRPASACGYSPRMRFDLMVNRMVRDASMKREIVVEGGEQKRTHLHIRDFANCIQWAISGPIGTFNVSTETSTVKSIAQLVKKIVEKESGKEVVITYKPRVDDRSYGINTEKISRAGFSTLFLVEDAIKDLTLRFLAGEWPDAYEEKYQNVYRAS